MMIGIIIREASQVFDVPRDMLAGRRKGNRRIFWSRMAAMTVCRHYSRLSLQKIGTAFGRDHTTVLHACQRIPTIVAECPKTARRISMLLLRLEQIDLAARTAKLNRPPQPSPLLLAPPQPEHVAVSPPRRAAPAFLQRATSQAGDGLGLSSVAPPRRLMVAGGPTSNHQPRSKVSA